MRTKRPLYDRVKMRIERRKDRAFVMRDFADMVSQSDYDQVLRALRQLVAAGVLIKIGRGIYAKTRVFSNGTVAICGNLSDLAGEAFEKLGIRTAKSRAWEDYNQGLTTQVPTGRVIAVDKRVRRTISYNGYSLFFERMA